MDGLNRIVHSKAELARRERALISLIRRLPEEVDVHELLQAVRQAKQMVFSNALSRFAKRRARRRRDERRRIAANLAKWLERARQSYAEIDPGRSYYGTQRDDPLTRIDQLEAALRADPISAARAEEPADGPPARARRTARRGRLRRRMDALGVPDLHQAPLLEASGLSLRTPSRKK